jgi:hypothetical protein
VGFFDVDVCGSSAVSILFLNRRVLQPTTEERDQRVTVPPLIWQRAGFPFSDELTNAQEGGHHVSSSPTTSPDCQSYYAPPSPNS